jgi:hypothetical protein
MNVETEIKDYVVLLRPRQQSSSSSADSGCHDDTWPLWTYNSVYQRKTHTHNGSNVEPKDRDEVNRREVWELDGWVWDLEAIVVSSIFKFTRKSVVLVMMLLTFDLSFEENAVRW